MDAKRRTPGADECRDGFLTTSSFFISRSCPPASDRGAARLKWSAFGGEGQISFHCAGPDRHAVPVKIGLHVTDGVITEVENTRGEDGIGLSFV